MSNAEYWEKRILINKNKAINDEKKILKQLNKIYKDTFKEIEKEIMMLFQRYSDDNNLTYQEAIKNLTSREYSEWRMDLEEYINLIEKTGNEEILLELNTLAMKSRISRLEQLTYQVNKQLNKCFTYSNDITEELLVKSVTNAHSDIAKSINLLYGLNSSKNIAKTKVLKLLEQPWSGSNFSMRIWSNRDMLAGITRNELTKGIFQGKSSQNICKEISKRMECSKSDIMRVVRTERAYATNVGILEHLKDNKFELYKYKAAIGQKKTCTRCKEMHNKIIKIEDAIVGENFPPLHPNCRCTIVPVMNDDGIHKTRNDFQDSGAVYYVRDTELDNIKSKKELKEDIHAYLQYNAIKK